MRSYEEALAIAKDYHGHICSGQVLGIRLLRYGLTCMGLENDNLRNLMIFAETDRCALDAIYAVTGMTMGRRRIKLKNHGKMAMTLVDLRTGRGLRLWSKNNDMPDPDVDCTVWWQRYTDVELFGYKAVTVDIPPEEKPGRPQYITTCAVCGELVLDNKHVHRDGRDLCRDCADGPYWQEV